jgi:DNA-binding response OmpR family regulator
LLAKNAGEILSRDHIFTSLRGIEYDGFDRSVDVRISHLRKKLKDHTEQPKRLKTVWGKGYLFVADAWG